MSMGGYSQDFAFMGMTRKILSLILQRICFVNVSAVAVKGGR